MQISVREERTGDSSLPSAGVAVIVVCLAMIGFLYYWRDSHRSEQARLVAETKAANAWRAPALATNARMAKLVSDLEHFDPAKHSGSKSLAPLEAEFKTDAALIKPVPKDATGNTKAVAEREARLCESISGYLHFLSVACAFQEDRRLRMEALEFVAEGLYTNWWASHEAKPGARPWKPTPEEQKLAESQCLKTAQKMDDTKLKEMFVPQVRGELMMVEDLQQSILGALNRPEVVSDGQGGWTTR